MLSIPSQPQAEGVETDAESNREAHKPHVCTICDKRFSHPCRLNEHVRSHTAEKPYRCGVCHKAFSLSTNFDKHMRVHTGDRPHKCDVCHQGFITTSHLRDHKKKHTRERGYKCNVCPKAFETSRHLKDHMRLHSGDSPFACDFCHKGFANRSNLYRHNKKTHSVKNMPSSPSQLHQSKPVIAKTLFLLEHGVPSTASQPPTETVVTSALRTQTGEKPLHHCSQELEIKLEPESCSESDEEKVLPVQYPIEMESGVGEYAFKSEDQRKETQIPEFKMTIVK